jgi:hypothetical protein
MSIFFLSCFIMSGYSNELKGFASDTVYDTEDGVVTAFVIKFMHIEGLLLNDEEDIPTTIKEILKRVERYNEAYRYNINTHVIVEFTTPSGLKQNK